MKITGVIRKSYKEQKRDFWLLLMTVTLAPFFVFLYFLMLQAEAFHCDILIVNRDLGTALSETEKVNHAEMWIQAMTEWGSAAGKNIFTINQRESRDAAVGELKNREADLLAVIPEGFSKALTAAGKSHEIGKPKVEFVGDLTHIPYLLAGVWVQESLNHYIRSVTGLSPPVEQIETPLGVSAQKSEFDLYVPGLIIIAMVMLIYTAAAAIVRESEYKTLQRLKIAPIKSWEFLGGISIIQMGVGILSLLLTLLTAVALGFKAEGSIIALLAVISLTGVSMIGFSLIIAAFSRSVKDVVVIGTFPLFLLAFFTGAMFKLNMSPLIQIGNYEIAMNDILSPTHAVKAMDKILIMGEGIEAVGQEIAATLILSFLYFGLGLWAFKKRHMQKD